MIIIVHAYAGALSLHSYPYIEFLLIMLFYVQMQSERQPAAGRCRPVSEVVQRIIGRSGLSQLLNRNSNPLPESATPTSVHQEMAQTFPCMYSAPGPSRRVSSYPIRGTPYSRQRVYVPRPPKNFLKRIVLVAPGVAIVPKGKVRQQLHDDGCICDMMEFNGSWDEEAVMKSLVEAFVAVLDPNAPAPKYSLMTFTLFNNNIVINTLLL